MSSATYQDHFAVAIDARDGEGHRRVYIVDGKPSWTKGTGHGSLTTAEVGVVRKWAAKKWQGHARVIVTSANPYPHVKGKTVGLSRALLRGLNLVGSDLHKTITVVSGYRSPERQAELYKQNMNPKTGQPYPGHPLTAKPGTSNHEKGLAADVYIDGVAIGRNDAATASMRRHGVGLPVTSEAWHCEITSSMVGAR